MAVGVQVVIDCADPARLGEFWAVALGYERQAPPPGFASWPDFLTAQGVPESEWNSRNAVIDPDGRGPRLFFLVCGACLAISALYELFEWRYAVAFGVDQAEVFLGSQGASWDAQEDMTMALFGSILAQLLLGRLHDRQIATLSPGASSGVRPPA